MNTTPTRMAYDRLHKATTAKYSRSISYNTHPQKDIKWGEVRQPPPHVIPLEP